MQGLKPLPMYKKNILTLSFLFLFSLFTKAQNKQLIDVYWSIGHMKNDSLEDLSYKLLQSISQDKIQGYDSSGNLMTKKQIEKRINPELIKHIDITIPEITGIILVGDYSILDEVDSKYSSETLVKMVLNGENIDKLIKFKKRKPFESTRLKIGIFEKIELDTLSIFQKGDIKYIRLIIPAMYAISKKDELLCQLKYEDFNKLNLPKEQKNISERKFIICSWDSDILVVFNDKIESRFSEKRKPGEEVLDKGMLDLSIFKFFKNHIKLFNPLGGKMYDYK